jgi:MFS transporter, ACS family, hexuronate transporter
VASANGPIRSVSPATVAGPLSRREAYELIAGLAFGWVIVFGGMSSINPLLPFVRAEFRLSGSETGLLTSLFTLPYLLMQIPGGLLADRYGAKRLLVLMLLLAGLCLTSVGLWPFGLFTFLPAMMLYRTGCSVYYSTSFGTSAGMVPAEERGLVAALLTMGTAFGGAVGTGVAVPLCNLAGGAWRFPFLVFGLLTLALLILFLLLRWPQQQVTGVSFRGLTGLFKDRTVVTLLAINLATNYGNTSLLIWGPSFLGAERGLSPVQAGYYIALVNLIGFPTGVLSGVISDRIGRRYLTMCLFVTAGLSIGVLAWFRAPMVVLGAIIGYGLFGKWTADGPLTAWLGDHTTRKYPTMARAVFGVNNAARVIGSLFSPLITGTLLDRTGTLSSGLLLAGAVLAAAGLLVLSIPRERI